MNPGTTIRYAVQRQEGQGEEWRPASSCNSMAFARIVANTGLRRHIGVCYRLIDNKTGATTVLSRETERKAA